MAPKRPRIFPQSICPSEEDGVIFTKPEHRENYRRLASRTFLHTTYFKDEMLDELGFRRDIEFMAAKLGWSQFLKMKEPAYKSLTYEFLSTSVVKGEQLNFRLGNQERELTLFQFNNIFGFSLGGLTRENDRLEEEVKQFWKAIAYCPRFDAFYSGSSTATDIYNPCYRLMQRFVGQTIYGRDPTEDTVMIGEMYFLYAMWYDLRLKTSSFIVSHLKKLSSSKRKEGVICVGGIITSIARYFDIDLDHLQPLRISWINIDACVEMRLIFKRNSRYYLRVPISTRVWPLPDVANTTVQKYENLKLTFENDNYGDFIHRDDYNAIQNSIKDYIRKCGDEADDKDSLGPGAAGTNPDLRHNAEVEADNEDPLDAAAGSDPDPDLCSILNRVENVELQFRRLHKIESMMQTVYDWHVGQGHFPTPPPK